MVVNFYKKILFIEKKQNCFSENDYYKQETKHTKNLQEDLFEEMKSRIKEDDRVSHSLSYAGYVFAAVPAHNLRVGGRRGEWA